MKTLKFKKIDAFTGGFSKGNPAGFIWMEGGGDLNEVEMQQIAAELKGFVNEVGYVHRQGGELTLRFYSAECEVNFCGHATIAILYDLLKHCPPGETSDEVLVHIGSDLLLVYNFIRAENAVYITAPAPRFPNFNLKPDQLAEALSISPAEINPGLPIRLVDGGLRTLIVPLSTLAGCLNVHPDQESLRLFCLENDIDIIHISVRETSLPNCLYRTRVFAPKYGYLEDPATGSGNAAFGYYLLDENLWEGDMTLEQGPHKTRPNLVKLKRLIQNGKERILFGGSATVRIEGSYYLQDAV